MNAARWRITVQGTVQGVGFRPFVYTLATDLGLSGWVMNAPQGALIEAQAASETLKIFEQRLWSECPIHAEIDHLDIYHCSPISTEAMFEIRHSKADGIKTAHIVPDLAICPDCLREINDPTNRRYRYPFTNCTHCGPRFSIINALPYDRANTTLHTFTQCPNCQTEYDSPTHRRFHAQPNACPVCGPKLALWDEEGYVLAEADNALNIAVEALRHGAIVALKGLGGFQLLVDARNDEQVRHLRQRKGRYEKPFAVMMPSLAQTRLYCAVSVAEEELITSQIAPIVLLTYLGGDIAPSVAPENPYLGVMLPSTPLHHLLMNDLGFPIVATSGNRSGDPIEIDEHHALDTLKGIADLFLIHDRPIARPVDDSVVYLFEDAPVMLRRGRGYAPSPILVKNAPTVDVIAVGTQQKNAIAIAHHGEIFVSQHLGEMGNPAVLDVFHRTLDDFQRLYDLKPAAVACDLHPDYTSTHSAEQLGLPIVRVQHHHAHILSAMAEHHLDPSVLGVAWDGTGYGTDGTVWGGEFLRVTDEDFQRVAYFAPFMLPGGDAASHEPRRSALGMLYALYGEALPRERFDFTEKEFDLILTALRRGVNCPQTSSVGRLFDGVAALLGLRQRCSFEGQAAMALEYAQHHADNDECYPFFITPVTTGKEAGRYIIEWSAMIEALLKEQNPAIGAAKFHNTLAAMLVGVAQKIGEKTVVLSGGCFQNRRLLEKAVKALRQAGFTPFWQQRIPPNDGGLSLGQAVAALKQLKGK